MRSATGQRYRRPLGFVSVVVGVLAASMISAVPASAHNVLISSSPAAGSLLAHAPTSVTLVFDQDVDNVYAEMAVTVGSEPPVEFTPQIQGVDVTADLDAQHLSIPAQRSGPTAWKIGYRIVSADGHPVSGLVNFTVGTVGTVGTSTTGSTAKAAAPQADQRNSSPPWLLIGGTAGLLAAGAVIALIVLRRRRTSAA